MEVRPLWLREYMNETPYDERELLVFLEACRTTRPSRLSRLMFRLKQLIGVFGV